VSRVRLFDGWNDKEMMMMIFAFLFFNVSFQKRGHNSEEEEENTRQNEEYNIINIYV
jgi:hypothetical protein